MGIPTAEDFSCGPLTDEEKAAVDRFVGVLAQVKITKVRPEEGFAEHAGKFLYPITPKILKSWNEYGESDYIEVRQAWIAVMFACGVADLIAGQRSEDLTDELNDYLLSKALPYVKTVLLVQSTL